MPTTLETLPQSLRAFVPDNPIAELGPGTPIHETEAGLASLDLEAAFQPHTITDPDMAAACHSGLWLANNFLDTSHTLSQSIDTPTGSFWHGIMHRREGDFSNAKYWFRKVGSHPIFESLASVSRERAQEQESTCETEFLCSQSEWDPMAFIDLCEQVSRNGQDPGRLCGHIGRQEWELLMLFSFEKSIAK